MVCSMDRQRLFFLQFKYMLIRYESRKDDRKHMKKTVYIAGTNKLAFLFQDLLNPQKAEFGGYVTFHHDEEGQFVWGGYPLIPIEQYESLNADYLVICDEADFDKIDRADRKIVSPRYSLSVIGMYLGEEYYIYRKKAIRDMKDENICGIITGMSYTQRGINAERMSKKWCMCAYPSQDLYYDFFALADAIRKSGDRLKYAVMGISPYSFRYDLSLSKGVQEKVYFYYREFGEFHNAIPIQEDLELMVRYDNVLDELCYPNWRDIYFDFIAEHSFKRSEQIFDFTGLDEKQQEKSLEEMKKISNKPYTDTIAENRMVFDMYMKLCKKHNIKVTVLIPPCSVFFRDHFPNEYVEETRDIISEFRGKYDMEILDLYDACEFADDRYYMDEAHMNKWGAEKLTQTLDEFLIDRVYN